MEVYLDTSVIVPLFVADAHVERARRFLLSSEPECLVSDYAIAEFTAVIGRKVRAGDLMVAEADSVLVDLRAWAGTAARLVTVEAADLRIATALLSNFALGLRAPDALHIAIARRCGGTLATFDVKMAVSARALGVELAVTD